MAQILVVNEEFRWYQAVAALDNYYEIDVEDRILQHASGVFQEYYAFKCKYTFHNRSGETSDPDILLISRDFTKWLIVEVELTKKSLAHTRKQMRVFTKAKFDIEELVEYSIQNCSELAPHVSQLKSLFMNASPGVLVLFDSYHKTKLPTLQQEFKTISICVFEIYKTKDHELETYRISGDYPYVASGYTFLKSTASSYEIYEIERPQLVAGIGMGSFDVLYKMAKYSTLLMVSKGRYYLKIPRNPFPANTVLLLHKTIDNKFFIQTVN